ncbi:serine acetyltransferase [uncultured Sphingomonas sp.]|mgnify:CR=1 FL=1|uniref:serine O-acetyltransferase n=1 Tax=uncultured Sphingomonas sp. TaxID=158754 RepID=UPI0025DE4BD4|nr:serine acetyltransferase [uncultured Sphingomonas sp.]
MLVSDAGQPPSASRLGRIAVRLGRNWSQVDNPEIARVGLMRLVREDLRRHDLGLRTPGFRAVATYRLGAWARSRRSAVIRVPMLLLHGILFRYVRNHYGIEIHSSARIGRRLLIGHQHGIVIHRFATFGDDCIIRQGVTLGEAGIGRDNFAAGIGPVIGANVDIGVGAIIIGNVRIGDRVNIGPNAVVMTDVPADTTVLAPMSRLMPRAGAVRSTPSVKEDAA